MKNLPFLIILTGVMLARCGYPKNTQFSDCYTILAELPPNDDVMLEVGSEASLEESDADERLYPADTRVVRAYFGPQAQFEASSGRGASGTVDFYRSPSSERRRAVKAIMRGPERLRFFFEKDAFEVLEPPEAHPFFDSDVELSHQAHRLLKRHLELSQKKTKMTKAEAVELLHLGRKIIQMKREADFLEHLHQKYGKQALHVGEVVPPVPFLEGVRFHEMINALEMPAEKEGLPYDTLTSHLAELSRGSMEDVVSIGLQISRGLHILGKEKVSHHDLSINNVFVRKRDRRAAKSPSFDRIDRSDMTQVPGHEARFAVDIADFGIARPTYDEFSNRFVGGTPGYIPASRLTSSSDPRSDLFALGQILRGMIVGHNITDDLVSSTTYSRDHRLVRYKPDAEAAFTGSRVDKKILWVISHHPFQNAQQVERLLKSSLRFIRSRDFEGFLKHYSQYYLSQLYHEDPKNIYLIAELFQRSPSLVRDLRHMRVQRTAPNIFVDNLKAAQSDIQKYLQSGSNLQSVPAERRQMFEAALGTVIFPETLVPISDRVHIYRRRRR